jgi:hypothetical protein
MMNQSLCYSIYAATHGKTAGDGKPATQGSQNEKFFFQRIWLKKGEYAMADEIEVQPVETGKSGEGSEQEATQKLDDATFEPRTYIEQTGDYKQAEAIQASFVTLVENTASATADASEQAPAGESAYPKQVAGDIPAALRQTADESAYPKQVAGDIPAALRQTAAESGFPKQVSGDIPANLRGEKLADGNVSVTLRQTSKVAFDPIPLPNIANTEAAHQAFKISGSGPYQPEVSGNGSLHPAPDTAFSTATHHGTHSTGQKPIAGHNPIFEGAAADKSGQPIQNPITEGAAADKSGQPKHDPITDGAAAEKSGQPKHDPISDGAAADKSGQPKHDPITDGAAADKSGQPKHDPITDGAASDGGEQPK